MKFNINPRLYIYQTLLSIPAFSLDIPDDILLPDYVLKLPPTGCFYLNFFVEFPFKSPYIQECSQNFQNRNHPVTITNPLQDKQVDIYPNTQVSFPCRSHSQPSPTYKWFLGGQAQKIVNSNTASQKELSNSAYVFTSKSNSGDIVITKSSEYTTDQLKNYQGEYHCEAENQYGKAQSGKILVKLAPQPTALSKKQNSITVNQGESILLPCTYNNQTLYNIQNSDYGEVSWRFYDTKVPIVQNSNRRILNDGSLLITSIGVKDPISYDSNNKFQCVINYNNPKIEMTSTALKYDITVTPGCKSNKNF